MLRWTSACLLVLSILLLPGCHRDKQVVPDTMLPDRTVNDAPLPSYPELVTRYNRTADLLSPIRADARVDMVWRNEKGDIKNEHGDGRFMFIKPGRVVLEVEEFGKGFWAGADGERYWFFDFLDQRVVYVGRFDQLDRAHVDNLPLPVNPADLLHVMGLAKIDPTVIPEAPAVERVKGHYLIEPPGLAVRMLLDPETTRPVRVDLLDDEGKSRVICLLKDPIPVEPADSDDPFRGRFASVIDVVMPANEARMTLTLKKPTHSDKYIREAYFDFDKLYKALKIDELIDVDPPVIDPVPAP